MNFKLFFSNLKFLLQNKYAVKRIPSSSSLYSFAKSEYRRSCLTELSDGSVLIPEDEIFRESTMKKMPQINEPIFKSFDRQYRIPANSNAYMYYNTEYRKGSFVKGEDGSLLIPNGVFSGVKTKEKVR